MARSRRRGYTLKELVAVIVIILVLAGLFLPAMQIPSKGGHRANCINNLSQISRAGVNYAVQTRYLPTSRCWASKSLGANATLPADFSGDPEAFAYTWVQPLLSHLDRNDVVADLAKLPQSAQASYGLRYNLLICSSDTHEGEGPAALDYAINAGRANCDSVWQNHDWKANGGSYDALRRQQDYVDFRRSRMKPDDLIDGSSHTIAFAENIYLRTWCLDPTAKPPVTAITEFHSGIVWDPNVASFPALPASNSKVLASGGVSHGAAYAHPNSRHPGGFNLAMWDGSARFVSNSIDYTVYARLMSSDGRRTQDPCTSDFDGPTPPWQAKELPESED